MTTEEMDIQLIEACVLEKWNQRALGCEVEGREGENCCLCQVYLMGNAVGFFVMVALYNSVWAWLVALILLITPYMDINTRG